MNTTALLTARWLSDEVIYALVAREVTPIKTTLPGRSTLERQFGPWTYKQEADNTLCHSPLRPNTMRMTVGNVQIAQHNFDGPLYRACEGGDLVVVQHILLHGTADINCRQKLGRTPVMVAAIRKHVAVFDFLVSQGCDITVADDQGDNVLHMACRGGDVDIVWKLVVNLEYDMESRGRFGRTAVMVASYFGHREVFDLLVDRDCDLSVVDYENSNILHVACIGGRVDMVDYVLTLNINDIESEGEYGRTPVMEAAGKGHRAVFDLLVAKGCNLTAVDNLGSNTLHVACVGGFVAMITHLLSLGIFWIDGKGMNGMTPVMIAAMKGRRRAFDLLVERGCDLTSTDGDGRNILHMACYGGDLPIVNKVLTMGVVDENATDKNGKTPLHFSEFKGHIGIARLLTSRN